MGGGDGDGGRLSDASKVMKVTGIDVENSDEPSLYR